MSIIKADEGKIFRRIVDGQLYGNEIDLGYSYYISGVELTEPHLDIPEDFEQIDDPALVEVEIEDTEDAIPTQNILEEGESE